MSAPKHTAGPWQIEGRSFHPKGRRLGWIISHGVCPEGDGPKGYVCRVEPMFSDGPSEADARLIATAPNLLSVAFDADYALTNIIESFEFDGDDGPDLPCTAEILCGERACSDCGCLKDKRDSARAAIAKATGEGA